MSDFILFKRRENVIKNFSQLNAASKFFSLLVAFLFVAFRLIVVHFQELDSKNLAFRMGLVLVSNWPFAFCAWRLSVEQMFQEVILDIVTTAFGSEATIPAQKGFFSLRFA